MCVFLAFFLKYDIQGFRASFLLLVLAALAASCCQCYLPVMKMVDAEVSAILDLECVVTGASMLAVDEGSTSCLCGGVLGASDPDSPREQLTFHLETPPLHGFLENTLPAPGSEKSNAGVRVGVCVSVCVCAGVCVLSDLRFIFSQNPSALST